MLRCSSAQPFFPLSLRSDTFKTLINDLANLGLPATEVTKLDELRDHYNKIKHQAGFVPGLLQSLSILRDARDALAVVVGLAPGRTNQPADRQIIHHLQVAFWDNYIGGYTEIAISLPSDHWTGASTIDLLYIRAKDWDGLKVDLLADARFHLGQEHFSPEVWSFISGEGDFLDAGSGRAAIAISYASWQSANGAISIISCCLVSRASITPHP